jgi:hypothetical protein
VQTSKIALLIVLCILQGCDDPVKVAADKKKEEHIAKVRAESLAANVAEKKTMSDPKLALEELNRQLDSWLVVQPDGLITIFDDKNSRFFVVSSNTSWAISCVRGPGLEVTIGSLDDASMSKALSRFDFTTEQCKSLSLGVGQRLRQMFRSGERG